MDLLITDYNGADRLLEGRFDAEWSELEGVLTAMPIHLKASDQKGKQGDPIFDAVGTNSYIKDALARSTGWRCNILIPAELSFLGTDVDYAKRGVVVEVQFSNYPFLLNNLLRSELFQKEKANFTGEPQQVVVLVTKAGMFPASNSTLYYEQAKNQLDALARFSVFDVPIRLVGLSAHPGPSVPVVWTTYSATRYSRTVVSRQPRDCRIRTGRKRCSIEFLD